MAGEATATAGAHGAVEQGSAGMPQLEFSTFPNQIFWLAVSLVLIFLIVKKVALPRISAILENRVATIQGDIKKAEELRALAAEAQTAFDEAVASARAEGARIAQAARDEIAAELADATAKADAQIAARTAESEKAIAEIREQATANVEEVARDTAEALVASLGNSADPKTVAAAVAARMKG